jgi:predicted aspartyl protease
MTIIKHQIKLSEILLILCFPLVAAGCVNRKNDTDLDKKLNQLLNSKNYFKLREILVSSENKLIESKELFYKAFVAKAFGDRNKSNECINVLLDKYRDEFNDTIVARLLDLRAANFLYAYKYKQASDIYAQLLNDYPKVLDSADLANYNNVRNIFGAFSHVSLQFMHRHNSVEIASFRNKFNHLMTPVKSNGVSDYFIFDTGANLSTIAESQARRMNLTILEQKVDVGSSTQINVQSRLAVADSFYVGEILFENVVFLVMPDDKLTFPEINYQIQGIIGFPVIHQMEEVHMHKDGSITIPGTPTDFRFANMVLEGLNPVVQVVSQEDTLLFTFDTGAKNSELSFKYFNDHKNEI